MRDLRLTCSAQGLWQRASMLWPPGSRRKAPYSADDISCVPRVARCARGDTGTVKAVYAGAVLGSEGYVHGMLWKVVFAEPERGLAAAAEAGPALDLSNQSQAERR